MHTYFIEWTSEGCSIKGALVIANNADEADQLVRNTANPPVLKIITCSDQTERGAQVWMLGELE